MLHVRNKPKLGWQVKTRNERTIPLMPVLVEILRGAIGARIAGPVFRRRRFHVGNEPFLAGKGMQELERELARRIEQTEVSLGRALSRAEQLREARKLWRDMGGIKTDRIRLEFMHLTRGLNFESFTAPKSLRHLFATSLQDANVDPLIRNELMGHSAGGSRKAGSGLGMTAAYTHTRPETRQKQLEGALRTRPALAVAMRWLEKRTKSG
jgi:integrase